MRRFATWVDDGHTPFGRLAILFAAALLAGCQGTVPSASGVPGSSATPVSAPTPAATHRFAAAPGGTQFEAPATDVQLSGLRIVVPPGALAKETELTVSAGLRTSSVGALAEADPMFFYSFADYLVANLPPGSTDPTYTPLLAIAAAQPVGPALELGPHGQVFEVPVEIILPPDLVGEVGDDLLLTALRSASGTWEICDDVTASGGTLRVPVSHFSDLKVIRVARNIISNPSAGVDPGWLAAAQTKLGAAPLAATERAILRLLACEGSGLVRADQSKLPSNLADVLNYLGRDVGGIGDATAEQVIKGLEDYVDAQRRAQVAGGQRNSKHFVTMEALLEEALRLTKFDAFQALVAVHGVLRDNRTQEGQIGNPFQDALGLLRGDGGDEDGARYHYFGAAIYSFVYAHQRETVARLVAENPLDLVPRMRNAAVSFVTPDPETTVRLEEAWVSGDIFSDVMEYAVNLQGAAFGRALYEHFTALAAGQESPVAARLCASMDGTLDIAGMPGVTGPDAVEAFEKLVTENRISVTIEQGDGTAPSPAHANGDFVLTIVLPGEFFWGIQTGIGKALGGGSAEPMPPAWRDCSATTRFVGTMTGVQSLTGTKGVVGFEGTATITTTSSISGCEDTGQNLRASDPQTMKKIPWSAVGDATALHGEIQVHDPEDDTSWTLPFDVRRP